MSVIGEAAAFGFVASNSSGIGRKGAVQTRNAVSRHPEPVCKLRHKCERFQMTRHKEDDDSVMLIVRQYPDDIQPGPGSYKVALAGFSLSPRATAPAKWLMQLLRTKP